MKFNAEVTFDLETRIEPEGVRFDRSYPFEVSEFEDNSYFQEQDVESSGGSMTFVIEADSEETAETIVGEIIFDGQEVEDDLGLTWVVASVSVELEEIEEPMTLERALGILKNLASSTDDEEVTEAVEFLVGHLSSVADRLVETERKVELLVADLATRRPAGDMMGQE
jgi:hypothetical protein